MTELPNIHPALAGALAARGYETLTPVQQAVIDPALNGRDLLVSAQTGSGKTVAFGLALAPTVLGEDLMVMPSDTPMVVAIAPTRELALQVKRELEWLYRPAGTKFATCVGGMDMRDERRALARGAHFVVGTPGRLCDHIKRGSLDMSEIKAIVLDEADEMLKMGFREELELILGAAPEGHRSLMFSATVSKSIAKLTEQYQSDAVRINTVSEAPQHVDITYRAMIVNKADQENAIINLLQFYDAKNALVFGDTRVAVNRMTQRFNNRGFKVVTLSGELSQKERSHAVQAMRDGRARVCIATDVAARGLDLPDLELVIHASIPKNREALLHRSGRTGRAGRKGVSALIVPHNARRRTERLFNDAGITAEWTTPPSADDVIARDNERLLESLVLDEPVSEAERDIVVQLMKASTPETIATLFLRNYRAGRSSPEELLGVVPYEPGKGGDRERGRRGDRQPRSRNDFEGGTWFSLNLGRKQKAEPRWILPMLCKSGNLKKAEIGAIKISETRTFIEVAPEGVARFIEAIGPEGKIEKAITATRIDGTPDFSAADNKPQYKPRDKSEYPSKKKSREKSSGGTSESKFDPHKLSKKEKAKWAAAQSGTSYDDGDQPAKRKKPHKKKLARAAAKAEKSGGKSKGKPRRSGGGPKLKRKKRN
ncbi:MAG: DEAD/DEAH box helicase [Hellea sp.]|nr:DEAD/DEAH box helicase [Hellea sp.]